MQLDDKDKLAWIYGDAPPPVEDPLDSTTPADVAPTVKDYLSKKYADKVAAAQAEYKPTSGTSKVLQGIGSILKGDDPAARVDAIDVADEARRKKLLNPINEDMERDQKLTKMDQDNTEFGQKQDVFKSDHDATSPKSLAFQDFLKQATGKDYANQSYADLKELSPLAEKMFAAKEASKDRALTRETNATNKGIAATAKQQTQDEKTFNDAWQTAQGVKRGSSSGLYGMAQKNTAFAENGLRNIDAIRSGKIKGNENIAAELSADLNRLLSGGGGGADAGIQRIMPKSLYTDIQQKIEYLQGHPRDTIPPEMLANIEHQFQGQKDFWKETRDKVTGGTEIMLEPVFARNPDMKKRWQNYWTTDENDGLKPTGGGGGSGDVKMRAPSGKIKMIPADQVEAAKADGGVVVGDDEKEPKAASVDTMRSREGW